MVRLATQNIDRAACQIIVSGLLGEQRPGIGICDEPSLSVAVKRALEGAHEQIAFGSVVVDDAQTAITTVILRPEILTHLGNIGDLTMDNKALVLLNLGHPDLVQVLNRQRMSNPGLQFSLHSFENWFELLDLRTDGAIGNFRGSTRQLSQQLVIVDSLRPCSSDNLLAGDQTLMIQWY